MQAGRHPGPGSPAASPAQAHLSALPSSAASQPGLRQRRVCSTPIKRAVTFWRAGGLACILCKMQQLSSAVKRGLAKPGRPTLHVAGGLALPHLCRGWSLLLSPLVSPAHSFFSKYSICLIFCFSLRCSALWLHNHMLWKVFCLLVQAPPAVMQSYYNNI